MKKVLQETVRAFTIFYLVWIGCIMPCFIVLFVFGLTGLSIVQIMAPLFLLPFIVFLNGAVGNENDWKVDE